MPHLTESVPGKSLEYVRQSPSLAVEVIERGQGSKKADDRRGKGGEQPGTSGAFVLIAAILDLLYAENKVVHWELVDRALRLDIRDERSA